MTDLNSSSFWEDDPDLWDTVFFAGVALPGLARVTATHGRKLDSKSPAGSDGATITDKGYKPSIVEITLRIWEREQFEQWKIIAPTLTYRSAPPENRRTENARILQRVNAQRTVINQSAFEVEVNLRTQSEFNQEVNDLPTAEQIIAAETARTQSINARARSLARHDVDISHPALDTIQVHRVYVEEVSVPTPQGEGVYEIKIKCIESRPPTLRLSSTVAAPRGSFAAGVNTAFSQATPTTPATAPSRNGGAAP